MRDFNPVVAIVSPRQSYPPPHGGVRIVYFKRVRITYEYDSVWKGKTSIFDGVFR